MNQEQFIYLNQWKKEKEYFYLIYLHFNFFALRFRWVPSFRVNRDTVPIFTDYLPIDKLGLINNNDIPILSLSHVKGYNNLY